MNERQILIIKILCKSAIKCVIFLQYTEIVDVARSLALGIPLVFLSIHSFIHDIRVCRMISQLVMPPFKNVGLSVGRPNGFR